MRVLICFLLMLGPPSTASAFSAEEQLRAFANCAGRMMAQLEYQWQDDSNNADHTQHQRSQVIELLDAVAPKDRRREVLSWRADARLAQRALLRRAKLATDPTDAAWATQMADRYYANCTGLLLS